MTDMLTRLTTNEVSSDGGSNYFPIGGIKSSTLSGAHDIIDSTDNDAAGYKSKEYGETELKVSTNGNADEADTGLNMLHTASQNKTKLKFRGRSRVASGAKQFVFDVMVTDFTLDNAANDIVKFSFNLASSGAPVYTNQP